MLRSAPPPHSLEGSSERYGSDTAPIKQLLERMEVYFNKSERVCYVPVDHPRAGYHGFSASAHRQHVLPGQVRPWPVRPWQQLGQGPLNLGRKAHGLRPHTSGAWSTELRLPTSFAHISRMERSGRVSGRPKGELIGGIGECGHLLPFATAGYWIIFV